MQRLSLSQLSTDFFINNIFVENIYSASASIFGPSKFNPIHLHQLPLQIIQLFRQRAWALRNKPPGQQPACLQYLLGGAAPLAVAALYQLADGLHQGAVFVFFAGLPPGCEPLPRLKRLPLVGRIACGMPILAEQNIEGEVAVPEAWHADFILTCRGDSMAPQIMDGDLVAVRSQPEVENGEIAVVRIGDEATLKKVSFDGTTMVLQPLNPAYPLMTYTGAALAEVHIEGKAVGLCRGL